MRNPAFQFYPADWLSDAKVTTMSSAQEGAYIRAICFCWREGGIPVDREQLKKMLSKPDYPLSDEDLRVVQGCFKQSSTDTATLVHARLDQERQNQVDWREKSRIGGLHSAEKRRINKENDVSRVVQPNGNSSSSSSSSSSIRKEILSLFPMPDLDNQTSTTLEPPQSGIPDEFELARQAFPGDKRGSEVEWANFVKKHSKERATILPRLLPAIQAEKLHKFRLTRAKEFCPPWAMFSTWINQSRWTQELGSSIPPADGTLPNSNLQERA